MYRLHYRAVEFTNVDCSIWISVDMVRRPTTHGWCTVALTNIKRALEEKKVMAVKASAVQGLWCCWRSTRTCLGQKTG